MEDRNDTPTTPDGDEAVDGGTDQPVGNVGGANTTPDRPDPVATGDEVNPDDADGGRDDDANGDGKDDE